MVQYRAAGVLLVLAVVLLLAAQWIVTSSQDHFLDIRRKSAECTRPSARSLRSFMHLTVSQLLCGQF